MTDWTTCRVVRVRDGDLWGRNTAWTEPSWRRWVKLGGYWEEDGCFQIHMECRHGPLTPVLDADGLPVVTTVGDLGNVHLGRRIKYEGPGGYGREGIYQGTTADYPERDRCNMHVSGGYEAGVPLDTPCEVLA